VLLLAIVALEVPLALNLRDRVNSEVRSQALSQAEVAAATASGQLNRAGELRRIVGTIATAARGRVIITDRAKLEEFAGEAYGTPEAEYEKLMGMALRRTR